MAPGLARSGVFVTKSMAPPPVEFGRQHCAAPLLDRARTMRSAFNFGMVQIPPGSILTFTKDQSITATVVDNKRIEFEGETTSLTAAALTVIHRMGYKWQKIAGPVYWEFEGETLSERRDRMDAED